jgi:hypothetical protein
MRMTRNQLAEAISDLMEQSRIAETPVPKERRRGNFKAYLHPSTIPPLTDNLTDSDISPAGDDQA